MPLKWNTPPASPASPAPAPFSRRRWLTQAVAAGSLLTAGVRPALGLPPGAAPRRTTFTFTVFNLNATGVGSLSDAVHDANANPGADSIIFNPGLTGAITLTAALAISEAVSIQGPGPGLLSVSGGNADRIFYLYSTGTQPFTTTISGLTLRDGYSGKNSGGAVLDRNAELTLDNLVLTSNNSAGAGGALAIKALTPGITNSLTLRNSLLSGNHAFLGGGAIFAYEAAGGLTIENTQFVSNTAGTKGGALFILDDLGDLTVDASTFVSNTATTHGGAIFFYRAASGQQTLRRTTLSGNTSARGGGIYIYRSPRPFVIENSTLSGNHATGNGGGVYVYNNQQLSIRSSTIVSNSADGAGGGIRSHFGTLPITNTIVAGNAAAAGPDISGKFSLSYDLVQITGTANISDAGGNLFGLDPLLGALTNHGGPTQAHLPARNSPVLNAGDPAFAAPPATDQRGRPRATGRLDIGAVEIIETLFLPLIER